MFHMRDRVWTVFNIPLALQKGQATYFARIALICECLKILWYQFDFKRVIFVEVVTAYVSNTEKAH